MFNLMKGDCLELMKTIPDNSVDMVLTDPPYGTTACKWDNVIPFEPMWKELKRITKDNGAICLFAVEPFSSNLRSSNLSSYKYDFKWIKCKSLGANFCHAKNAPIRVIEDVCVFSEGKVNHKGRTKNRMIYKPQGLKRIERKIKGRPVGKVNAFRYQIERPSRSKEYVQEFTNYPTQELRMGFEPKERKSRVHPTQKPVALLEYLVKTYTDEKETVLDFTMGSGSTGVACANLNRKFIGIEKDEKYFQIAKDRIESARNEVANISKPGSGESASNALPASAEAI